MLRARLFPTVPAFCIGVLAVAGPALAQNGSVPETVFEIPLPGGLRGALVALNDRTAPDRSQFLLEVIRRSHAPGNIKNNPQDAVLRALRDHLGAATRAPQLPGKPGTSPIAIITSGRTETPETLPLPLSPAIWTDLVFGGRVTPTNLAAGIVQSPSASRLYYGLLSLDDSTRTWLATETDLIPPLSTVHSAAFAIAAPAFRVADGAVRTPGGEPAESVWQALVGRRANEPAAFLRALLSSGDGRLAYFFSTIAQLTPAQIRLALNLDAPDPARVYAARRLYAIFDRVSVGWKPDERPFWRPSLDPALLVSALRLDAGGRPVLPGTRRFWTAVFAEADPTPLRQGRNDEAPALAEGEPATLAWLCEQVFKGAPVVHRRPYQQVLFASRILDRVTPQTARDSVDAVRAAGTYPALVAALERAGIREVAVFASAGRKAAEISTIDDHTTAARALGQFQGMLALITRAVFRGSVSPVSASQLVASLSAVDLGERGEYEGRLVRWLAAAIAEPSPGATPSRISGAAAARADGSSEKVAVPLESAALDLLAGPVVSPPSVVDWEGTRYRLDFRAAEAARLARLLGDSPLPYLSSAHTLVTVADALSEEGLGADRLRQQVQRLEQIAQETVCGREASHVIRRATRELVSGGAPRPSAIAPVVRTLRVLADDLLARGLTELAYAVALGQVDPLLISAGDAASRHEFGLRLAGAGRSTPWELPHTGAERTADWRATGSLLGLDVRFSEFLLLRLTARPPPIRPLLNESDRRVLVEAVALADATALTDADRDVIVTAIRKGRARLGAVRTAADALSVADEIHLGPSQSTLLAWTVAHDPQRVATFLSPTELFWLGLEQAPVPATLHAFGAAAERRLGCLCLRFPDRQPWEMLAGRWDSGMLASGFADLNLRLTELLAELKMPAALLAPVLASATLDLVTHVNSREPDDRRALVEFVQGLGVERAEHYLALLTTDGPLVPVAESSDRGIGAFASLSETTPGVPR